MERYKKGEWLEIITPSHWNGFTIEQVLKEELQIPKTILHQFRINKGVRLNGAAVSWSTLLHKSDKFQLHLFQDEEYGVIPEYIEIHVLYEDDHILIVNKPAGIDTHPSSKQATGTLANAVAFYFQTKGIKTKIRHIHRLDRDTTGAVLFAKERLSGAIMDRQLEQRNIKRTYLALVHGIIKRKEGTIAAPIGRDRHHPTRRRVSPSGQHAVSFYKVLQTFPKKDISLVQLELQTGRTHQIRVHMSSIGHPLLGDKLYGGQATIGRQALHALKLRLHHPISNEYIECTAPFLDVPPIFP